MTELNPVQLVKDLITGTEYAAFGTLMCALPEDAPKFADVHFTPDDQQEQTKSEQIERDRAGFDFRESIGDEAWPYVSFIHLVHDGVVPLLLLSDLSEHTRNITMNDRVSLLYDGTTEDNRMNSARVTVLGRAVRVDKKQYRDLFFEKHPKSKAYFDFVDFNVYKIEIDSCRLVGGFASAFWIDAKELGIENG